MGKAIRATDLCGPFRGSEAIHTGTLTAGQLRGAARAAPVPGRLRARRDLGYPPAALRGAALILPPEAVITGRSAATVRGVALARASDPIEVLLPEIIQVNRRTGIDVRRTKTCAEDRERWGEIGLATPLRMGLDLLLDRTLPDAVANLDAVLRAGLVDRAELRRMLSQRRDHGIVLARQAEELADPRAESPPESRVRVWLVRDGLHPVPQYWIEDS
ncbi:MAG: hypothetical protein M3332_16205, partial [Actinomycetota bacterium]|nr:hypothetical protein [Actinomycetota bacterium]